MFAVVPKRCRQKITSLIFSFIPRPTNTSVMNGMMKKKSD